jgi:hypothetical protein
VALLTEVGSSEKTGEAVGACPTLVERTISHEP